MSVLTVLYEIPQIWINTVNFRESSFFYIQHKMADSFHLQSCPEGPHRGGVGRMGPDRKFLLHLRNFAVPLAGTGGDFH
jgi:hypothetical protein